MTRAAGRHAGQCALAADNTAALERYGAFLMEVGTNGAVARTP